MILSLCPIILVLKIVKKFNKWFILSLRTEIIRSHQVGNTENTIIAFSAEEQDLPLGDNLSMALNWTVSTGEAPVLQLWRVWSPLWLLLLQVHSDKKIILVRIKTCFQIISLGWERFSVESIHKLTDSANPSNHRRGTCRKPLGNTSVRRFLQCIWFYSQRKKRKRKREYVLPKENVTTMIMLYKNTKAMVHSSDSDTNFFDIVAGGLQEDILMPHLPRLCTSNVSR